MWRLSEVEASARTFLLDEKRGEYRLSASPLAPIGELTIRNPADVAGLVIPTVK
jgi:hypothetical protein